MQNYLDPEKSDRGNLHHEAAGAASGQLKRRRQVDADRPFFRPF
jgi:hypothetical protein